MDIALNLTSGEEGGIAILILMVVNLLDSIKADADILPRVDKSNELLYGAIELPNDGLDG